VLDILLAQKLYADEYTFYLGGDVVAFFLSMWYFTNKFAEFLDNKPFSWIGSNYYG
jgi:hypothetical protein